MNILKLLIGILWIIWLLYWMLSAVGSKRNIRSNSWGKEAGLRIAIIITVVLFLRVPLLSHLLYTAHYNSFFTNTFTVDIGFILFIFGFALSIWARVSLGKNWGMPTTLKEKPELVTKGPYAYVRHPIYTGIILAMIGTALAVSVVWLIPFVFISVYFIFSLKIEEKNMMRQFPKEYKKYKERTNALIPFIY